jgi:hypothetical protein
MAAVPGAAPAVAAVDYLQVKSAMADCAKFNGSISAVELRGEAGVQADAQAKVGNGQLAAGVFAGTKFNTDSCCRVEFTNGHPSAVVMRDDYGGELKAGAQAGPALSGGSDGSMTTKSMQNLSLTAKGKLSIETRYTLPPNTPPGADLSQLLSTCPKSQKATLTTDLGSNTGGKVQSFELDGDLSQLLRDPRLSAAFLQANPSGMLEAARAHGDVTITSRSYTTDALDLPIGAKVEGIGASLDWNSVRRNYSDPVIQTEPKLGS